MIKDQWWSSVCTKINDDHEHIQIVPFLCREAFLIGKRLKIRIPQVKQNRSETDQRLQCKVYWKWNEKFWKLSFYTWNLGACNLPKCATFSAAWKTWETSFSVRFSCRGRQLDQHQVFAICWYGTTHLPTWEKSHLLSLNPPDLCKHCPSLLRWIPPSWNSG